MFEERRRHPRKPVCLNVNVAVDTGKDSFEFKARSINVSLGGFYLEPDDAVRSIVCSDVYVGRPLEISFDEYKLKVWGDILRVERDRIAIILNEASNNDLWKDVCEIKKTA